MKNLKNKKILLVICGGIAAYKSLELIRIFKRNKCQVKTILTEGALQFITPLSASSYLIVRSYFCAQDGYEYTQVT